MMANVQVDCIYVTVDASKRQMPNDERIKLIIYKHEMKTAMHYRYIKRSSDKYRRRKDRKRKKLNDDS